MFSHKLDVELIDKTINSTYDMFPSKNIIDRLLTKWDVKDNMENDPKIKNKVVNRLKNKGFYWDDIQSVINTFNNN